MQKNLSLVQKSTVRYHFSFWILSDWNMKMGCYATFFSQRINLFLKGYIILERTHSFHGIKDGSPENLQKLHEKFYHSENQTKIPAFYTGNTSKPLAILERIWWINHQFIIKKNKMLDARLRKPNYESSLFANIL